MKKRFIVIGLLVIGLVICAFGLPHLINAPDHLATAVPIHNITEKHEDNGYYLTVVLDDCVVEEWALDYNQLTLPVEKSVYDKVTVNEGYAGMSLWIELPEKPKTDDVGQIFKQKLLENCMITSVTTEDNVVIG